MKRVGTLGSAMSLVAAGLSIALAAPATANGGTCDPAFSGGDGTSGTPYLISSADDVTALKGDVDCWASGLYLQQTADISMGGITWSDSALGTDAQPFAANYDGGGYQITGLNISFTLGSTDQGDSAGLFGELTGSLSNLGFTGSVTGTGQYVGGLVGFLNGGSVSQSFATGSVSGNTYTGGLAGYIDGASVSKSFATGAVSGSGQHTGGLIGYAKELGATGSTVSNSYATGNVTGTNYVGGLLASNQQSTVSDSYSLGDVPSSGVGVGRLVGYQVSSAQVTDSFWSSDSAGVTDGVGSNNSSTFDATGATTAELQSVTTFTDASWSVAESWSSSNTWGICESSGYPYLTWQYASNSEACDDGGVSAPATSSSTATYTFTFLTSGGGVCFVDDNVAAGAYALPTSQVACTPEGTELVGWSVPGQVGAFSDGGIVSASEDQTFTAVAKGPRIEVTFDPNVGEDTPCLRDGSEVEPDQRAVTQNLPRSGLIGEVDICAPAGHTLVGWTNRPTTSGPHAPVEGAMLLTKGMEMPATWNHEPNPVNSIRLYAVWSPAS